MASFPNRCQHFQVNGTQCGSPALRRNRFCYLHKRHHEERIALAADHAKSAGRSRRRAAIDLPVLEDANSIQISLMQIMRLIMAGDIDSKTAGLLLYALQTASGNLQRTKFEPRMHDVILDPRSVADIRLGESIWEDEDFEEEDDLDSEEEEDATANESKLARVSDTSVITPSGEEILKGFPLDVLRQVARELNQRT